MFKYLILGVLFTLNSIAAPVNLESPRSTFKTFLKNMVEVKNGKKDSYENAIKTFEGHSIQFEIGKNYAQNLIFALDRISKVDYSAIPLSHDGPKWFFDTRYFEGNQIEISMVQIEKKWYFSKTTLKSLDIYKELLKDASVVTGVKSLKTIASQIRASIPPQFQKQVLLFELWQWAGLFILLLFAYIIEKVFNLISRKVVQTRFKLWKVTLSEELADVIRPAGKLIFLVFLTRTIHLLDLTAGQNNFILRTLAIITSIIAMWFLHKLIEFTSHTFTQIAKDTENKFDDILIPLLTKTAFALAYIFGAILIADSLSLNVSGLLAGLGIGGLAFAFAAKDTLANFFGSIMLVLDRPFDIGDVVKAGSIEGTVVEVGIRSTRIRTFYDSIITVSNGEIMNMAIDNAGKRRFRRLSTTLGLEYNTPPEKIEAFCEGIRQLILNHKWTRKDYFNVYFTNFGASSLDIQLMVFWKTNDYTREQSEKHRLMIDILRLAKEIGVEFAFPTQTVHLYNEEKRKEETIESGHFDAGIEKAKTIVEKPLSLKNPRSNASDKGQFGDNDIGL